MTKVSVGWIVVVVVTVAAGLGVAQAQTFPDIHLDGGWKAWYFTLESRGQTGDGFMTGPVFSVDFDRKWTLGVAYLTTEIGKDVEATGRRAERSDFDMSLRYRLLDQLGVYVSFKRLEFSLDDRKEGELQHGSINGIGFGLAGTLPVWQPSDHSTLFLSGSAAYLPIAWVDIVTRDPNATTRAKNNWFTAEANVGYSTSLGPFLASVLLGYRLQNLTLETDSPRENNRTFQAIHLLFYGPTLTATLRW